MNININELNQRIIQLEKENEYLKRILNEAGVEYNPFDCENISWKSKEEIIKEESEEYDDNQGARIISRKITSEDASRFFSMFWGRTDVYAKRVIRKSTGEVNYFPQCYNFWKKGCPRISGSKIKCIDCPKKSYKKLDKQRVVAHLNGKTGTGADVIGVYPLFKDGTCRFIVFDFDDHSKKAARNDFANSGNNWMDEVDILRKICVDNGVDPLIERSRSGKGAHVWIFFQKPIDAALARKFGKNLLKKGAESVNLKTFRYYDRMLPMQDTISQGSLGNLIALPLQGDALKKGNSAFVDENWNAYHDQWEVLFSKQKLSKEFIEAKIDEWEVFNRDGEKPWERTSRFNKGDIDGYLKIFLADGIYIETQNLKPRIQNRIRELAAFSNPIFYKNVALGIYNYEDPRIIYMGEDIKGYIRIPRGLLEKVLEECKNANIQYEVIDNRNSGKKIKVTFEGELKENQLPASKTMLKYDNGILNAATAFGKTVVCCNIIAKRKVNTLILLQSSTLISQWEEAIDEFLRIDEEPPEYETPTGKIKKRKSVVGKLQGPHDSTTGIIDIAMAGSVFKKGEPHHRLREYGMIIVDECHHAASDTIVEILRHSNAKYMYGVTATPARSDGLEKINYMLIGPIRYKYTAKDRARDQGIGHLVYPRFTRAVTYSFKKEKMHPNDAYEILRDNESRDNIIIEDVINCVKQGRTPLVLSKYVDHAHKLYERLAGHASRVFLLTGANSKKNNVQLIEEMRQLKNDESMIIIATGQLVGEGFDLPRLDTLVMATPVSWKSVVEQYAGRLNRDYEGKNDVIIYDYIDINIPMFEKMYNKRLKAYKQIGYDIYTGKMHEKEASNSIFDIENYKNRYEKDLLSSNKEIIISSPSIRGDKVDELNRLIKKRQESGVKIKIITWKPDEYRFGDSTYWMELQNNMRNNGFEMNLVEDYCLRYCIIDREIVWYGSLNFLGKPDVEDNLMRVCSAKIAEELLSLTFGDLSYKGETI